MPTSPTIAPVGVGKYMTLEEASERVFGGNLPVSTLRANVRDGKLPAIKPGKKYLVTEDDLNEMVTRCRDDRKARRYGSTRNASNGSFATNKDSSVQASLRETMLRLKRS